MELKKRYFPSRGVVITLLLIVCLGGFLRFHKLDGQSLWNDELSQWLRSYNKSLGAVIHDCAASDVHPPGFHVLIYFVERYIGDSPWDLRLFAAVSGVLSIGAIYLVGVRLYSCKVGLIAAALMATLWCPIYYSQEARAYSMLTLFVLLSTFFWIGMVRHLLSRPRIPYATAAAYGVVAIVACYLHYFGLLFVMLQAAAGFVVLLRRRRALVSLGLVYLVVVIAYLPWVPAMRSHMHQKRQYIWPPGFTAVRSYLCFLFNQFRRFGLMAAASYIFLLAADLYTLVRTKRRGAPADESLRSDLWVMLWLTVPFGVAFLMSRVSTPVLTNRNMIISLPAAYLLLARAVARLPLRPLGHSVITVVLVGAFLWHLVVPKRYYSVPHKQQWREAVGYVIEHDDAYKDSLILSCGRPTRYIDYYFRRMGSARRTDAKVWREADIPMVKELIQTRAPRYVWYLLTHAPPEKAFFEFLERELQLVEHKRFFKAEVWLFERRQPQQDRGTDEGSSETHE